MIWTVLYVLMGLAPVPEGPVQQEISDKLFAEVLREVERQNNWEPEPETRMVLPKGN